MKFNDVQRFKLMVYAILGAGVGLMLLSWGFANFLKPMSQAACFSKPDGSLADIFSGCWSGGLPEILLKALTVVVLHYALSLPVKLLQGLASDHDLKEYQKVDDSNESPVHLLSWGTVALAILVRYLPVTTLPNYLAYLGFKLGFALILTVAFAFWALRYRLNIKTASEVLRQFRISGTDAVSRWMSAALLIAASLV